MTRNNAKDKTHQSRLMSPRSKQSPRKMLLHRFAKQKSADIAESVERMFAHLKEASESPHTASKPRHRKPSIQVLLSPEQSQLATLRKSKSSRKRGGKITPFFNFIRKQYHQQEIDRPLMPIFTPDPESTRLVQNRNRLNMPRPDCTPSEQLRNRNKQSKFNLYLGGGWSYSYKNNHTAVAAANLNAKKKKDACGKAKGLVVNCHSV